MGIAVVSVTLLILFMLGWRESLVVAVAIPTTLALTLLVFYLVGYTLNRITLFALIFSIGILVDDAIVVVENIVRHRDLPENRGRSLKAVAVRRSRRSATRPCSRRSPWSRPCCRWRSWAGSWGPTCARSRSDRRRRWSSRSSSLSS